MGCLSIGAVVRCSVGTVLLLLSSLLAAGCSRSFGPSSEDAAARTDGGDSARPTTPDFPDGANTRQDSGEAQAPPAFDAGPRAIDTGIVSDANEETECARDRDCPATDPCYRTYCGSSGQCLSALLPDGTSCISTTQNPRICIDGLCQESRCGDGYVQTGVELCDPLNDPSCKEDCTPAACGDGVIEAPVENCEPDTATGPCNDACRISDDPEWLVQLPPDERGGVLAAPLLLDSTESPIVIFVEGGMGPAGPWALTQVYKYDASGQPTWSWGDVPNLGVARSATVDVYDNIIIAGGLFRFNMGAWLAKLDNNGVPQWLTTIDDPSRMFVGVASDDQANIVAMSGPNASSFAYPWDIVDPRLELFDSDGTHHPTEQNTISGAYVNGEALSSGVFGGATRYLMAGVTQNDALIEPHLVLLNSDLSEVWDAPVTYSSPSQASGFLRALPTNDGDIIALGASGPEDNEFSLFSSFWLERFSPEGTTRWTEAKPLRSGTVFFFGNATSNTSRWASGSLHVPMAVDSEGNIFLVLQDAETIDDGPIMVIDKYGPDGSLKWERPIFFDSGYTEDPTIVGDRPLGLAVDSQGAIYVLSTRFRLPSSESSETITNAGLWLHKWQQPE